MKRTSLTMKILLLGVSVLPFALPQIAQAGTIEIVSDNSWVVRDTADKFLGFSQNVCLSANSPSNCPVAATPAPTIYGYPGGGWTANLSSLPASVRWIWAPNITGTSTGAASQEFTFTKEFYVCDPPEEGKISIAADNSAEVLINGETMHSITSTTPNALSTFTVPASSIKGSPLFPIPIPMANSITIKAKNGPNPSDCGSDEYNCNPAAVVLGASFKFTGDGTCTGWIQKDKTYKTGENERLGSCPPGEIGDIFHTCLCGKWQPDMRSCTTPPPTCTDNGKTYGVGERLKGGTCPPGKTGEVFRTCVAKDTWGPPDHSKCEPLPITCQPSHIGPVYRPGDQETRNDCPAGQTGFTSRTCQSDGTWGAWSSNCRRPQVGIGEQCGDTNGMEFATCPTGTTCRVRGNPYENNSCSDPQVRTLERWCQADPLLPKVGIDKKCGSRTEGATAQCRPGSTCTLRMPGDTYFCDPNIGPPLPLGAACRKTDCNCASTRCDWSWLGIGSRSTNICIPHNGKGLANDPCTHNDHCASGTCNNLARDASGNWIPGQCR